MSVLFHRDLIVTVLGSGSRGNSVYIGDGQRGLLVDCGISTKQVRKRLEAAGLPDAPIDAVLITHEHADHVGAAGVLSRRLFAETGRHIPFFMSRGTRKGLHPKVVPDRVEYVASGGAFTFHGWTIEPYTVPHDTVDPLAYVVDTGHSRVGVLTDLGSTTRLVTQKLASVDVAVLEFNHDVEMLVEGGYPWHLKQRIRSRHGHLSNDQAAELLAEVAREGRLSEVVLAHLSEENNTPEHARRAAQRALHHAGRRDVRVQVGEQDAPVAFERRRAPVAPVPVPPKPKRAPRTEAPRADAPATAQQPLFS